MSTKIIVDVDTGTDDAMALILALSRPDIDVVAITCVAGNCGLDQVCLNTLKVPMYRGAVHPLTGKCFGYPYFHGYDGLGDVDLDIDMSLSKVQEENAVTALIRLVDKYKGQIHLVALGPLTNIALALKLDPEFGSKLQQLTIMGGNTEGKGNAGICKEFNFASDPLAAHIVLNDIHAQLNLFPWEINLTAASGQPWEWYEQFIHTDSPISNFIKSIMKARFSKEKYLPFFGPTDLNAMATVVEPGIVMELEHVYATVELNGTYTKGMMVVDWLNHLGNKPNVVLFKAIDTEKARLLFESML